MSHRIGSCTRAAARSGSTRIGKLRAALPAVLLAVFLVSESAAQLQEVPPSFEDAVLFSAGQRPHGIATGKLNADDLPDIAYVTGIFYLPPPETSTGGLMCVRLNTGDWDPTSDGLGAEQCYPIGNHCNGPCDGFEIVIDHFNDDIWPDIAITTNRNNGDNPANGIVVIFLNDPSDPGTFIPQTTPIVLPRLVRGLASGEFNGDGKVDLAVAADPNNFVMTLHGNGAGEFGFAFEYELSDAKVAGDIVAGRFDSQQTSVSDLATSNSCNDTVGCWSGINSISRLLNTGAGEFDEKAILGPTSGQPFDFKSLAAGRLDGDQLQELVCIERKPTSAGSSTHYHMAVFRHDPVTEEFIHERPAGDNTGDHYRQVDHENARISAVAIGHLNSGSRRDVAVAVSYNVSIPSHVAVWMGNGNGTFYRGTQQNPMPVTFPIAPASNPYAASWPYGMVIVDLNDDGQNDIVTSNRLSNNLSVLINDTH